MTQHIKPCATCPFRRSIQPGYLGGSSVQTFVGQTQAGFIIPCHSCVDYDDPEWKAKASVPGAINECAGAAIFRSNINRRNPSALLLPSDAAAVFASHAEFIAHHEQISLPDAEELLADCPPNECARRELMRAGVVVSVIPAQPPQEPPA